MGGMAIKAIIGILSVLLQSSEGSDSSSGRVEMNLIVKKSFSAVNEHTNISEICRDSSIFYDAQGTLLRSSESQHIKFAL